MQSPHQELATVLLGEDVLDWIAERRTAVPRWTWELLADELAKVTDGKVSVSRETLRQWVLAAEQVAS